VLTLIHTAWQTLCRVLPTALASRDQLRLKAMEFWNDGGNNECTVTGTKNLSSFAQRIFQYTSFDSEEILPA